TPYGSRISYAIAQLDPGPIEAIFDASSYVVSFKYPTPGMSTISTCGKSQHLTSRNKEHTEVDGDAIPHSVRPSKGRVAATLDAERAFLLGNDFGNLGNVLGAGGKHHTPGLEGRVGGVVGVQTVLILGAVLAKYLTFQSRSLHKSRTLCTLEVSITNRRSESVGDTHIHRGS